MRGDLLGDELTTHARELAVAWLHRRGLTDTETAAVLRLSTYTAARIRSRLRLRAHIPRPHLGRNTNHGA